MERHVEAASGELTTLFGPDCRLQRVVDGIFASHPVARAAEDEPSDRMGREADAR
jgi:hypothetical protein